MPERARTLLRRWAMVAWATVAAVAFVGTAVGQPAPDPRPGTSLGPDPAPLVGGRSTASRAPARPATRAAPRPSWSRRARPSVARGRRPRES